MTITRRSIVMEFAPVEGGHVHEGADLMYAAQWAEEKVRRGDEIAYGYQYFQQHWPTNDATVYPPRPTRYLFVETGSVQVAASSSIEDVLEHLWMRHNAEDRPHGRTFCSMSVGDIVRVLQPGDAGGDGEWVTYRAAPMGFENVTTAADVARLPWPGDQA